MKKILLITSLAVFLLFISVYSFIPSEINITKEFIVKARQASITRSFLLYEGWSRWLSDNTKAPEFEIGKVVFTNHKKITENNGIITIYTNNKSQYTSSVNIIDLSTDSSIVNWSLILPKTYNPLVKVKLYLQAQKIKKSIDEISDRFKLYIENPKKIYGFDFKKITLQDSSMIALKASINHYPTVLDIYSKIEMLEKYASTNNAIATNFPMLNIQKTDSASYSFMVALPINKRLNNYQEIMYKQMLPNGNFLSSDSIYGGFRKIDNLFKNFESCRKDQNILSPAIPFQSLITDRRKEGDTTKWITKFYYPIF